MRSTFLALALAACGGGGGQHRDTLRGIAADAKGGAVVQTDDGRVIYVENLPAWPPELDGKRVEVTGRLARKKLIPDPVVSDAGEQSAGALGDQEVIEGAAWKASSPP